jgi:ankyrin repeat protein
MKNGYSAAMFAAEFGECDCLVLLIRAGCALNVKNNEGMTAAMLAAYSGYTECLRVLIQAGCDLTVENNAGKTAWDLVQEEGHRECESLLRCSQESQRLRRELASTALSGGGPRL